MPTDEKFILRTTLTSPFGFKTRLAVEVLGLGERVTVSPADVSNENDTLRKQNPLGKIPCLVRADGTGVFDSGVILECLQEAAGTEQLMPMSGPRRIPTFTRARLADGIMDAGALTIYEGKYHEPAAQSEVWLEYQRGKMRRGLAAFEAAPPAAGPTDAVMIGLAAALEFMDRRERLDWRPSCPRLVEWYAKFVAAEPAFNRTRPPAA